MFNDQRDRRDTYIAAVLVAIVCAGVYWVRNEPRKSPAIMGGEPVNVATFKLTDPLPQAHDGAREVIGQVYECVVAGKKIFSNRRCDAGSEATK